jgi:hypothetical protein
MLQQQAVISIIDAGAQTTAKCAGISGVILLSAITTTLMQIQQ